MSHRISRKDFSIVKRLRSGAGLPPADAACHSRQRIRDWFATAAPVIHWGAMDAPVGRIFVAASGQGLCALNFGVEEGEFLGRLDPRARLDSSPSAVALITGQLKEYFARERFHFELPLDLSGLTPFQCRVLETLLRIPRGGVWTYRRLAGELGRPRSSRPVGQALAHNPIPIIIPCHRVIASDGNLGGYSGAFGIETKRWLLRFEGALPPASVPEGKGR